MRKVDPRTCFWILCHGRAEADHTEWSQPGLLWVCRRQFNAVRCSTNSSRRPIRAYLSPADGGGRRTCACNRSFPAGRAQTISGQLRASASRLVKAAHDLTHGVIRLAACRRYIGRFSWSIIFCRDSIYVFLTPRNTKLHPISDHVGLCGSSWVLARHGSCPWKPPANAANVGSGSRLDDR